MSWPPNLTTAPLRAWPGTLTPPAARRPSPFRAELTATLQLLEHELGVLHARDVEMLVAISPDQFRLDGRPRATAKATHPGVVLSFDVPQVGHLSYPCDRFTTWQDNLRAIALSLEALRKIDRYGVTHDAEQYRGFLALEQEAGPVAPADDIAWLRAYTGLSLDDPPAVLVRRALRRAHPDAGGNAADFQTVTEIEQRLRQAGRL